MSNQVLNSYQSITLAVPSAKPEFIRDYYAIKEELKLLKVAKSGESPQQGVGDPNGVITANSSMLYFDMTGAPTLVSMYFNPVIGALLGWIPVS